MKRNPIAWAFGLSSSLLLSIGSVSCGREPASRPQPASSDAGSAQQTAASPAATTPPVPPGLEPLPDSAFRVEWATPKLPSTLQADKAATVTLSVKNTSGEQWPSKGSLDPSWAGAGAVRLSYRWLRSTDDLVTSFEDRVDLSKPLGPGESAEMTIPLKPPAAPGDYKLQFDLVQESVAWFNDKGAAKLIVPVKVQ